MPEKRLFLCKIQLTRPAMLTEGPTPQEAEITSRHFDYLQEMTKQGIVLLAGRTLNTDPSAFGIVLWRAESEEQAWELVRADPGQRSGQWTAELYPFRIALLGEMQEEA